MKHCSVNVRIGIMRTIIVFLTFVISNSVYSQNNRLVIDFVDNNYGEKVGSGVCADLMYMAREYVDSVNGVRDSIMEDVSAKEVVPGDMIEFSDVLFSDGHFIKNHIAVVYRLTSEGVMTIAQQNVGEVETYVMYMGDLVPLVKDSHVAFGVIDMSKIVSGKVSFYRL